MKKLFTFIAFVAMTMAAYAQYPNYDVNNDGEVNVTDVACLTNHIVGLTNPSEDDSAYHYDMNGDEIATVTDVLILVDFILNPSYLTCPNDHHPHMVDLGLTSGTKWACCNVGADKPEAYGGYYAWGETEEKTLYDWSTYIHCDEGRFRTCHDLGSDIAGTDYDVAHVKWGGSWVMPSKDQLMELLNKCSRSWTKQNGVNGLTFTGPSGGKIFLPAAGYRGLSGLRNAGGYGYYWSSTQSPSDSYYACRLSFYSGDASWHDDGRHLGQSVRPVSK